ncbi:MurR/RpiR family transcriptional regulator [Motiliproteus sp. MSK22-1]|uniref:MurR/RpiR family transcriptional regulator n=1 Tax=Motiliproteus sp. MSK22-1 TaxID=1897630 RepID=UPI000977EF15|nr:MurR/RpiR family transcriptional regulator [Motiliproteus sp. MSK22-1]OMH29427.1 Fe-S cluster assembly protein HesB [Motiliproteus sp. MSK22-1]
MDKAPENLNDLKSAIADAHPGLSKRLRQVAQYLLDHPNEIAFGTVAVISKDAGVHPSTLVRFANAFGYTGFTEMQRLFQQKLLKESPSYTERIRIAREELGEEGEESPTQLLGQFSAANANALDHLKNTISGEDLERAVDILAQAEATHIVGVRRAYVVASYFSYALCHIDRRAFLVDGVGGMYREQAGSMSSNDAVIAVSFHPYAQETQNVAKAAAEKGIPLIVITDSQLSPLASIASVCFTIKEAEVHSFRSLTSSLCLAQSLSIGLAYRLDKQKALTA